MRIHRLCRTCAVTLSLSTLFSLRSCRHSHTRIERPSNSKHKQGEGPKIPVLLNTSLRSSVKFVFSSLIGDGRFQLLEMPTML